MSPVEIRIKYGEPLHSGPKGVPTTMIVSFDYEPCPCPELNNNPLLLESWPVQISALLAKKENKGTMLDAIIDSGGGDIMGQTGKILKQGGRVVCYGM